MAEPEVIPPPPAGFTLDTPGAIPPPPAGFTVDAPGQTPPPPKKESEVGLKEKIAGFPLTRYALGRVSPILGVGQFVLQAADLESPTTGEGADFTQALTSLEEAKKKGMDYWAEKTAGFFSPSTAPDWLGIAGAMQSGGKAMKYLPEATKAMQRIRQGAGAGAAMGITTPVTGPSKDFWNTKALQTGLGTLAGTVIPSVLEGGRALYGFGENIVQSVPKVARRLLTEYQRNIIGEAQIPAVQAAVRNVEQLVSKPTVAESLVGVPEGSPIQAHQEMAFRGYGGASSEAGKALAAKEAARESAWAATDGLTAPLREASLTAANARGGIPTPGLQAKIFDLSQKPGMRGSHVVQQTLAKVRERIDNVSGAMLKMDANDLYTIRKELGTYIASASKETANFDKKMTGGLLRDIQNIIDDSIEQAGGTGWRDYLAVYSRQAQRIEKDLARQEAMYQPPQKTTVGGVQTETQGIGELPHLLQREFVYGNFLLGMLRKDLEPAINAEAARRYLNPDVFSKELAEKPYWIEPDVWNTLVQTATIAGATAGGRKPLQQKARASAQALGVAP